MSRKLLLADDSITIQRVVELTFADQDVQVVAVGDGEQAIARIPVDQPDIVLADIGMPKRSGYDVAAFVKGHPDFRHIPVLLLAGAFEPVDEARAEQVGCSGVLVKPFEPQHVIARVRELLGGAIGSSAQAAPDMGRPVDRLASPRTLEFPQREEDAPPDEAEALPDLPAPVMDVEPDAGRDSVDAFDLGAAPAQEPEPVESVPDFTVGESLDDYFARLGAALETNPSPGVQDSSAELRAMDDTVHVPTLEDVLGTDFGAPPAPAIDLPLNPASIVAIPMPSPVTPPPVEPPDTPATLAPQAADVTHAAITHAAAVEATHASPLPEGAVSPARNIVADAFTALLAVEQGEPGAAPIRLTSSTEQPVVTEALVDELTRRIVARLAPDSVRDVVAQVVSEVAERLVREEIERIRSRQ